MSDRRGIVGIDTANGDTAMDLHDWSGRQIDDLRDSARRRGGLSSSQLDLGAANLRPLWLWVRDEVREHRHAARRPAPAGWDIGDGWHLPPPTIPLLYGIACYLGEMLIRETPHVRWALVPQFMYEEDPPVPAVGTGDVHVFPVGVATMLVGCTLRGSPRAMAESALATEFATCGLSLSPTAEP